MRNLRSLSIRILIMLAVFGGAFGVVYRPGTDGPSRTGETLEEGGARDALRWYNSQRAYPSGVIPVDWRERASVQMQALLKTRVSGAVASPASVAWQSVGPTNIGGRIRSIAIDPLNSAIIYCGSVSGGIWKSTDSGKGWSPISDAAGSLVIGALAIDPVNTSVIYAGTGEGYYNVDALRGIGVLKTTNGGASWSVLGHDRFIGADTNNTMYFINKLVIRPDQPQTIFAAVTSTSTGIWKSTDAGASWNKISAPGVMPKICTDIVLDPSDPNVIYASFGLYGTTDGIYKSTNSGTAWRKLTNGFPPIAQKYRRISLAISRSNPQILYASLEDSTHYTHSIQKSTNGGSYWFAVGTPFDNSVGVNNTHLGGQGWYNNVIAVDPNDPAIVYAGGINLFKSTDGGQTWRRISDGYAIPPVVHVDQHAIMFAPGSSQLIYFGNDGGMFRTLDAGTTFQDLNNGLVTTQFYSGAVHPTAEIYYGGTQDNGTIRSGAPPVWTPVLGGDGGYTAVNKTNPSVIYSEYVYCALLKSSDEGQHWLSAMGTGGNSIPAAGTSLVAGTSDRTSFITPLIMDPSNSQVLVAGTYRLYRTTNGGIDWLGISGDLTADGTGAGQPHGSSDKAVISAVAIAPSSSATIYSGSSGSATAQPKVYVTTNTGSTWTDITRASLPKRYIRAVAVDPTNRDRAVLGFSGYGTPHVFLTTNRGTSWTNISGGLPDIPVNSIVIDPDNGNHMIIGTDLGIFESSVGANDWVMQNSGLANVSINELILRGDGICFAATHGRGMFRTSLSISVPSVLDIAVHQNPVFSRYVDLYVISRESLSTTPSLTMTLANSTDQVNLTLQSPGVYRGSYVFPQTAAYTASASALDSAGQLVAVSRMFQATLLKAGTSQTAYSPDSLVRVTVPSGAFPTDAVCTIMPRRAANVLGAENSTSAEIAASQEPDRPVELAFPYDSDRLAGGIVPVLYRASGDGWTAVESRIDEDAGVLRAAVMKLGQYAVGYARKGASGSGAPAVFRLDQNFPNPFNPSTTISYQIGTAGAQAAITIYDITGREVTTLVRGNHQPGSYSVVWSPVGIASGVYFCRLSVEPPGGSPFTITKKMVYLR